MIGFGLRKIIEGLIEALTTGAFAVFLGEAWHWAIGAFETSGLAGKAGEEFFKRVTDPKGKGWGDESRFAEILSRISATRDQRNTIVVVMLFLEQMDRQNGTRFAKNFRIVVTYHAGDDSKLKGFDNSGIAILQEIATTCQTPGEVLARIMAIGAMHDPLMTQEKFVHLWKTIAWSTAKTFTKEKIDQLMVSADKLLTQLEEAVEKKNVKFKNIPLWMKFFGAH